MKGREGDWERIEMNWTRFICRATCPLQIWNMNTKWTMPTHFYRRETTYSILLILHSLRLQQFFSSRKYMSQIFCNRKRHKSRKRSNLTPLVLSPPRLMWVLGLFEYSYFLIWPFIPCFFFFFSFTILKVCVLWLCFTSIAEHGMNLIVIVMNLILKTKKPIDLLFLFSLF